MPEAPCVILHTSPCPNCGRVVEADEIEWERLPFLRRLLTGKRRATWVHPCPARGVPSNG